MDAPQSETARGERLARASALAMSMAEYADVPEAVLAAVRSRCVQLPEVVERPAWAGTQWRVRNRTFAHVLAIDFADGAVSVITFRSAGEELEMLRRGGHPFFRPAWGVGAVGMVLEPDVDWDEVGELLTESYCVLAPKKLVARIERPTA